MICLWATQALAAPLALAEVLAVVDERVPELAAAESELAASAGKLLEKQGAFDPILKAKGKAYDSKDPRSILESSVSVPTVFGPSLMVGYGVGVGEFPAYDGDFETGDRGEVVLGAEVPLLRGMVWSEERATVDQHRALFASKEHHLEFKRLSLRRKASEAYWKWVAAGAILRVDEGLLQMAEGRIKNLRRLVEEGARPRLDLLDNERVVYERRAKVQASLAKVEMAAQGLSLYFRDGAGNPQVVGIDALPDGLGEVATGRDLAADLDRVAGRPDIASLEDAVEGATAAVRGTRSSLLPDVRVSVEHREMVGSDVDETIGALSLYSSLAYRKGRGQIQQAHAAVDTQRAWLQRLKDQAQADIRSAHARLEAALEQADLGQQAVVRAEEVAVLERRRFSLGGADLFQVLLREEVVAKDTVRYLQALLALRLTEADLALLAPQ